LCEVGEDGVGFRKDKAIVVEHGRAAVGVDCKKLGRAAFAFENIDFDNFTRNAELGKKQPDFVGITGVGDVV
jgi:hypothetical protein